MLLMFVRLAMTLDISELQLIPTPTSNRIPWQGFTDLRISLAERGMVGEAMLVFRQEFHRTPLKDRVQKANEVIGTIANMPPNDHDQYYLLAEIKEQLTSTFVELQELSQVTQIAKECSQALDQWCEKNDIISKTDLPLYLSLQYDELSVVSDGLAKLKMAEDLSELARRASHRKLTQFLDLAAELALKLGSESKSKEMMEKFYFFRQRIEFENEFVLEDLCSLVGKRHDIQVAAAHNLVDRQKQLEWINGFFLKYPDFRSPWTMAQLYKQRALTLSSLKDDKGAAEAQKQAEQWSKSASKLRGVWHYNWANIIAPVEGAQYDSEDEVDSGYSTAELTKQGSSPQESSRIITNLMHLVIDWAFQDVKQNLLGWKVVQQLFGMNDDLSKECQIGAAEEFQAILRTQDAVPLFRKLFLPRSAEDSMSEFRYQLLHNWLAHPPKGSRNIRLYWLIAFLESRQGTGFLDSEIVDIQRLLDLQAKLPRVLKSFTESRIPFWHAALSWRYMLKFWRGGSWALFDFWNLALKAQQSSEKSLEGFRKFDLPGQIAEQQRLLARLNWLKIRRLTIFQALSSKSTHNNQEADVLTKLSADISSNMDVDNEMRRLRNQGLQWLYETDSILGASEREASWEDGLGGIEKRAELAKQQQSYTTIQCAIQLLLSGPESNSPQEDRKTLWELVQKYKTRQLSVAIGMYRPSPPGLVKNILSSKEYGPIYQKMIDLQNRISTVDAKDRFYLRRQLDAHRKEMKKHRPLRQLIDLREGTPIEIAELGDVSKGIGVSVVFVDWYFVQEPIGLTQLLLLTARSGETPIIDALDTHRKDVEDWIHKYLGNPGENEKRKISEEYVKDLFNKACGSLIAPLAERTQPGEVLVFCPTEMLHRLPLHALDIEEEPLIRRNPVVYVHSHSLLRYSRLATEYAADLGAAVNPQFLSGIGGGGDRRFSAGRNSIIELASRFHSQPMIDGSSSKTRFLDRAQDSRLVHIHTHCMWDSTNPLDHHLVFPSLRSSATSFLEITSTTTEQQGKVQDETLTAREIFALKLQPGLHVNLIACSGGLIDVQAGDEVMGLVPALLYSSASSTISTLWPIPDKVGANFSHYFFRNFAEQVQKAGQSMATLHENSEAQDRSKVRWVDMAMAMREAVMKLDPEQTKPLESWAGFVLHGFWMFHADDDSIKGASYSA